MNIVLAEPLTLSEEYLERQKQFFVEAGHEFTVYDTKPASAEEWCGRIRDADVVMMANTRLPEEVLRQAPRLKYLNIAFTGTDHVPVQKAKERGIVVSNAAGYSDQAVAELTVGMAIALLRRLSAADQGVRAGQGSSAFLGGELAGRTVGIIGTGQIGQRVAELFRAFGVRLIGYSRSERASCRALGLSYMSLEEVLAEADIVTLHLPLNENTRHLIGAAQLERMKPTACLINCARGPIVDQKALCEALKQGRLAAAGIDVFDQEPPLPEGEALFGAENALLTPHIGYFTREAMLRRGEIVFQNTRDFLAGRMPGTCL